MIADLGTTERVDHEQAERIDEALTLQANKGSCVAACYLEFHGVGVNTALRVLQSPRHRPGPQVNAEKEISQV